MELEAINAGILSIVPPVVAIRTGTGHKRGGILPRAWHLVRVQRSMPFPQEPGSLAFSTQRHS